MAKGGYREKAGRKTSWASGCSFCETTTIRVPLSLKNTLLAIAHKLDAGKKTEIVTDSQKEKIIKLENLILELEAEIVRLRSRKMS